MSLSKILKNKTAEDFERTELESLANEYGVSFNETNRSTTIFSNLVKSLESFTAEKVKVKFLVSPTGLYGLGYNVGDVAPLSKTQADTIVENKHGVFVTKK